ncbi:MAG: class II glutamine amidotransferase [Rhodocyclales bacterium]|nr:class II glutamine amidotransferase [Rhodocyclales bacterium]
MCELFGMSASHPLTANVPLDEFRLRGGREADNPDGWGLAWREKRGFEIRKRPAPACRSRLFARLSRDMRSDLILAHVRKARFPPVRSQANTHPFRRACCGREWVFAHNGLVPDIVEIERGSGNPVCRPTGETDSEFAFCHLLGHIARHFDSHAVAEPRAGVENLAAASGLIASLGKFNFLMSDGEYLIAYGHDRLHYLERSGCAGPDGACANLAMVATEPLGGEEGWIAFDAGELRVYRHGKMAGRATPHS